MDFGDPKSESGEPCWAGVELGQSQKKLFISQNIWEVMSNPLYK